MVWVWSNRCCSFWLVVCLVLVLGLLIGECEGKKKPGLHLKRGAFYEPNNRSKILPPPALKTNWKTWKRLMPVPLQRDFREQIRKGERSISITQKCPGGEPVIPQAYYWYHEGKFWYPNKEDTLPDFVGKLQLDIRVLDEVANLLRKNYGDIPSFRMSVELASVPNPNRTCASNPGFPPIFALASTPTTRHYVRRPTMYLSLKWLFLVEGWFYKRLTWEEKRSVACWRGDAANHKGSALRFEVLQLQSEWERTKPSLADHLDMASTKPFVNNTFKPPLRESSFQDHRWFSTCKYNFNLAGHTMGGYSRALQSLFPQLTVPLYWENPWSEYYYDWLKEDENYVVVNFDTLEEKLDWLLSHDKEAERIAERNVLFYEQYLTKDSVFAYWQWLVLTYVRLSAPISPADVAEHLKGRCICDCSDDDVRRCSYCPVPQPIYYYFFHPEDAPLTGEYSIENLLLAKSNKKNKKKSKK